ncbi:MAG: hypothetical protein GY716_15845 [bacterium]|nr:hypothetical protein [bacterium]
MKHYETESIRGAVLLNLEEALFMAAGTGALSPEGITRELTRLRPRCRALYKLSQNIPEQASASGALAVYAKTTAASLVPMLRQVTTALGGVSITCGQGPRRNRTDVILTGRWAPEKQAFVPEHGQSVQRRMQETGLAADDLPPLGEEPQPIPPLRATHMTAHLEPLQPAPQPAPQPPLVRAPDGRMVPPAPTTLPSSAREVSRRPQVPSDGDIVQTAAGDMPQFTTEPTAVAVEPAYCQADEDGDCQAPGCPQLRDGEPRASGRDCPLPELQDSDNPGWSGVVGPDEQPPYTGQAGGGA